MGYKFNSKLKLVYTLKDSRNTADGRDYSKNEFLAEENL